MLDIEGRALESHPFSLVFVWWHFPWCSFLFLSCLSRRDWKIIQFPKCTKFPQGCKTDCQETKCALLYHPLTVSHLPLSTEHICLSLSVCLGKEFSGYQSHFSFRPHLEQNKKKEKGRWPWPSLCDCPAIEVLISWRYLRPVTPLTMKALGKPGCIAVCASCVLGQTLPHLSIFIHWLGILLLTIHSKMWVK